MICPNCKKNILYKKLTDKDMDTIVKLRGGGFSFREIEAILKSKGTTVSISTLSRFFKNKKNKNLEDILA